MNREPWPESEKQAVAAMIAAGKTAREVAAVTGRSRSAIIKAVRAYELGAWNAPPGQRASIPADFVKLWPTMPIKDLGAHFGVSGTTAFTWGKRLNLGPRRGVLACAKSGARPKADRPRIAKPNAYRTTPVDRPNRDTSLAGEAADFLRKFGPVIRCDAKGHYSPRGDHWLRGSTLLAADEVVARARRNGWNPEAWRTAA